MVNIWPIIGQISGVACALCNQPGERLCSSCTQTLPYNHKPCPRYALPLPEAASDKVLCADCQAHSRAFDSALAPLLYQPPVDDLVAGLKYQQQLHLGPVLSELLAQAVRREGSGAQVLLPVPMPGPGLRKRGFNQAAELARQLSLQLEIPWAGEYLLRVRDNRHQQSLRRDQRRHNMRGVFACRGTPPAQVALIDDVMTTGATAEEASRILKRAGVARVEVWTVARTPRDHWTRRSQKR